MTQRGLFGDTTETPRQSRQGHPGRARTDETDSSIKIHKPSSMRHRAPTEAQLLADTYRGHAYDAGELEWYTNWCRAVQATFGPKEFGEVAAGQFSTKYMDIAATVPQTAAEREVRYSLCASFWLELERAKLVPSASTDFPPREPVRAQLPASSKRKSKF